MQDLGFTSRAISPQHELPGSDQCAAKSEHRDVLKVSLVMVSLTSNNVGVAAGLILEVAVSCPAYASPSGQLPYPCTSLQLDYIHRV